MFSGKCHNYNTMLLETVMGFLMHCKYCLSLWHHSLCDVLFKIVWPYEALQNKRVYFLSLQFYLHQKICIKILEILMCLLCIKIHFKMLRNTDMFTLYQDLLTILTFMWTRNDDIVSYSCQENTTMLYLCKCILLHFFFKKGWQFYLYVNIYCYLFFCQERLTVLFYVNINCYLFSQESWQLSLCKAYIVTTFM